MAAPDKPHLLFICSRNRVIHVLDIPDDYRYMDPELVAQIGQSVAALLDLD